MTGRVDMLMQAAGLRENVLGSLERGDALFVLTQQTLLFQDSGGTRRVTLRDMRRIHSDQDGLLRVETPAGTALTASLLGFDPVAVQNFFKQVKDATARAKEQPETSTLTPTAATPSAATPPQAPPTPPAAPKVVLPGNSGGVNTGSVPASTAPAPMTQAMPAATPPAPPASSPAAAPTASFPPRPAAPTPVPSSPAPAPTAPPTSGGLGLSAPASLTPAPKAPSLQAPAFQPTVRETPPQEPAVKPTVKAVRTPAVIADPEVAPPLTALPPEPERPAAPSPAAPSKPATTQPPVVAARVPQSAAGTLASLAAYASAVAAWTGRLRFMSVVMLIAALALAYLQFDKGLGLNAVWVLIAGGMSAVGLWALGDLVRLIVSLAQAVSAEGGVMDVD